MRLLDSTGTPFMGVGLVWLLERIDSLKSISRAAADMELSYPKALRMLADLERVVGPVVQRHKGGSARGGADLTEIGRELLEDFSALRQQVQRHAEELFEARFKQRLLGRMRAVAECGPRERPGPAGKN